MIYESCYFQAYLPMLAGRQGTHIGAAIINSNLPPLQSNAIDVLFDDTKPVQLVAFLLSSLVGTFGQLIVRS